MKLNYTLHFVGLNYDIFMNDRENHVLILFFNINAYRLIFSYTKQA